MSMYQTENFMGRDVVDVLKYVPENDLRKQLEVRCYSLCYSRQMLFLLLDNRYMNHPCSLDLLEVHIIHLLSVSSRGSNLLHM